MEIKEIRKRNLRTLVETIGEGKQSVFGKAIDTDPSLISQILNGTRGMGEKLARKIEARVGFPPNQMDRLIPHMKAVTTDYEEAEYFGELGIQEPKPLSTVPLISWVDAGEAQLAIDLFQPGEADEWVICPVPHSERTYALRVQGESMTAPTGRSFPEGIDIFVDPEQRGGVVPNDFVIAKINGRDAVTFKQLACEEGRPYLRPLNPSPKYEPIFDEFRVLGKVIYAGFKP